MNHNRGLSLSHKTHFKITLQLDKHNINKELNWNFLNLCPGAWIKHEAVFAWNFSMKRDCLQQVSTVVYRLEMINMFATSIESSSHGCACPSFHYVCSTKSVASNGAAGVWFSVNTQIWVDVFGTSIYMWYTRLDHDALSMSRQKQK